MDDRHRRDELDAWLHAQIEPLPPPPGTFEMIKRRARRRRFRQAAVTAAAAAAVAAAVIVVPRVATSVLNVSQNPAASAAAKSPVPRPAAAAGRGRTGEFRRARGLVHLQRRPELAALPRGRRLAPAHPMIGVVFRSCRGKAAPITRVTGVRAAGRRGG